MSGTDIRTLIVHGFPEVLPSRPIAWGFGLLRRPCVLGASIGLASPGLLYLIWLACLAWCLAGLAWLALASLIGLTALTGWVGLASSAGLLV